MVRASSCVVVALCALPCGCAAFLDYDGLTGARSGSADGGDAIATRDDGAPSGADGSTAIADAAVADRAEAADGSPATTATPDATALDAASDSSMTSVTDAPVADAPAGPGPAPGADAAKVDPCSAVPSFANGQFCGSDGALGLVTSAADPNTLYTCANGRTAATRPCPDGCMTANVVTNDSCNP